MNMKAQTRIAEINQQIQSLTDEAVLLQTSNDSTRKAAIAIDLRTLLTERSNIEQGKNPNYVTVQTSDIHLAVIAARAVSAFTRILRS